MTDIRQELTNLLFEAVKKSRYGKAIAGSETYAPGVKEAEDERLEKLLAKEEGDVESVGEDDVVSLDSDAFRLLCIEGLNNDQCLKRLEPSLGGDFSSNPKINPSFAAGISYVVSFYASIIESYNSRQLTGKVKIAIDSLISETAIKKNEKIVTQLTKLFTSPKESRKLQEIPYEDMIEDITDLCIATHIVNWTRILTYQTSYNNDLMDLKDVFKAPDKSNKANKANKQFVSKLSDVELDKFYSKENPNVFADYIQKFPWGRRDSLNEEAFKGIQGDLGKAHGDNEVFLLNCLVSYLIDVLKTGAPHPEFIFNTANAMSIQNAKAGSMYELDRVKSLEDPVTLAKSWDDAVDKSSGDPDFDDPDYNMTSTSDRGDSGTFGGTDIGQSDTLTASEAIGSIDLAAMEAYRDYVEDLRRENNWTSTNTMEFLSRTLKTRESSDGLSAILKHTFKLLPGTIYDDAFTFPVVVDDKVETVNILSKIGTLTLSSNFIKFLSNLVSITANLSVYKETEIKPDSFVESYIKAQFDMLTEARELKVGLAPEDVRHIISNLPKTLEETLAGYDISQNSSGYVVTYNNQAAKDVNRLYKPLSEHITLFKELSPSDLNPVPPEGLVAGSPLQKSLSMNIVPRASVKAIGMTTKEKASGQVAVRGKNHDELEKLWDVYYTAIKDIIEPTINVSSWGLLTPTRLGKPDEPSSSYGVLCYTPEVPAGSKADNGGTIKALFNNKGEFSPVRDAVLNKVASLKESFLAVKTEEEVKTLLQQIVATFGKAKQVRFFASPATQTCPAEKKSTLAALIDPSIAITPALKTVFKNKVYSGQHKLSNPFTDLISSAIVLNNMTESVSIVYRDKTVLFEANEPTSYELIACYVAINTQIRARILLATASLMDIVENALIILREIITELKTVLTHLFAEDVVGRADKFFKDVANVLVSTIPKAGIESPEDLTAHIAFGLSAINKRFQESEEKAKKVSSLKKKTPWTGELYGSKPKV
ncbi:MAG: hypothetical protein JHC33_03995 [Ignisphaera sp.]|nr:hypothetical protein [Ignisphaera sp.]